MQGLPLCDLGLVLLHNGARFVDNVYGNNRPKNTVHGPARFKNLFKTISIFPLMVFTLIFLFFFTPSAKRGDAADMLVLPDYSDVNNGNLDYVLK